MLTSEAEHRKPPITRMIPVEGLLRLSQVLQLIPVSRSCLFEMISRGEFARPVKLAKRVAAWRVEDVRTYIDAASTITKGDRHVSR